MRIGEMIFLLIDLGKYDRWKDTFDKVLSCETILSGSLHGLIISRAYKIPNLWIEFGEPLIDGHFKIHDFFLLVETGKLRRNQW